MKLAVAPPLFGSTSREAAGITVPMTEAQWRRHDMQVRWLLDAIAAQARQPDEETFDRLTLRMKRGAR